MTGTPPRRQRSVSFVVPIASRSRAANTLSASEGLSVSTFGAPCRQCGHRYEQHGKCLHLAEADMGTLERTSGFDTSADIKRATHSANGRMPRVAEISG